MPPRVSVVIAAYNREGMVQDAIRSAQAQGPVVGEILVIDDGSTDHTATAARALSAEDPRLSVHTQPNAGPSSARNRGWEKATGEWVFFLDSDDLLAEGALPDLVRTVPNPTGLEVPYGTQEILGSPPDLRVHFTARLDNQDGNLFDRLAMNYQSTIFSALFPRSLVRDIGGFDETIRHYEDNDFALRVALEARFRFVDRPVYRARMHADNRHRTFPEAARDQRIRFIEKAITRRQPAAGRELLRRRAIANIWWQSASHHLDRKRPSAARHDVLRALALCPWKLGAWRLLALTFRRRGS